VGIVQKPCAGILRSMVSRASATTMTTEFPLGSHVVTPRRGYLHHGIYVGGGKVVHYAGLAHGLRRGPVEEVSLVRFARGRPVWMRPGSVFDQQEVVCRARSRLGEQRYRLLSNNCEHFCEWCLRGEPRSFQVEAWLRRPARMLLSAIRIRRNTRIPVLQSERGALGAPA
jgi:hypothetical protein